MFLVFRSSWSSNRKCLSSLFYRISKEISRSRLVEVSLVVFSDFVRHCGPVFSRVIVLLDDLLLQKLAYEA